MAPRLATTKQKAPESEVQAIARRLRMLMDATSDDLKAVDICKRAGIAQNTFSQWVNAISAPDRFQARKLKRAFGWSLDFIYEGDASGLPTQISRRLPPEAA